MVSAYLHLSCSLASNRGYHNVRVLKAVVSRYLDGGSRVYGCLVDASKGFDTVDQGHWKTRNTGTTE